jgi:hypothetical protein
MPANRSSSSAPSRRWLRGSALASPTGARRLMREIVRRRSAAAAGALIVSVAVSLSLTACGHQPKLVMDDFESGALTDWKAVGGGSGGWFIYTNGSKAPNPARSDPSVPFDLPNPPQGRFAAVSDTNGPGTRILYRDVRLDGRLRLHLSVFYAGVGGLSSPRTLAYDEPRANQQFRIDLVAPSAPIDSVARGAVLVNVFATSASDPERREPTSVSVDLSRWAGRTVRLRLAVTDNAGPLRAGVDDIRFEPVGPDKHARIELPPTPPPARALNVVLHRMTEADALKALRAPRRQARARG